MRAARRACVEVAAVCVRAPKVMDYVKYDCITPRPNPGLFVLSFLASSATRQVLTRLEQHAQKCGKCAKSNNFYSGAIFLQPTSSLSLRNALVDECASAASGAFGVSQTLLDCEQRYYDSVSTEVDEWIRDLRPFSNSIDDFRQDIEHWEPMRCRLFLNRWDYRRYGGGHFFQLLQRAVQARLGQQPCPFQDEYRFMWSYRMC